MNENLKIYFLADEYNNSIPWNFCINFILIRIKTFNQEFYSINKSVLNPEKNP